MFSANSDDLPAPLPNGPRVGLPKSENRPLRSRGSEYYENLTMPSSQRAHALLEAKLLFENGTQSPLTALMAFKFGIIFNGVRSAV